MSIDGVIGQGGKRDIAGVPADGSVSWVISERNAVFVRADQAMRVGSEI